MTPSQAAQEKPTSPRSEAGQALLDWIAFVEKVDDPAGNTIYDEISLNFLPRIEREAAAATPSLDVLRRFVGASHSGRWEDCEDHDHAALVHEASAALARLDEGSATPMEADHG